MPQEKKKQEERMQQKQPMQGKKKWWKGRGWKMVAVVQYSTKFQGIAGHKRESMEAQLSYCCQIVLVLLCR